MPHLAVGGGWSTSIMLYNLREVPALGTLRFYDQQGRPLLLPVSQNLELSSAESVDVVVQPNGSKVIELPDIGSATQQGYAVLTRASGSLSATLTFRQRVPGRADFEATLPSWNLITKRWAMSFDNVGGYSTSFAVQNPDSAPANVLFTFYDNPGNVIAAETITLAGGQQQAFSSPARWPAVLNRRGTVHITRVAAGPGAFDFGINVAALRFNPTGAFSWIYMEPPLLAVIRVLE